MQTYTISRGEKTSAKCTLRTATWQKLVSVFTTHKVGKSKDEHGYFVGGTFANNYRNAENMLNRSLVTIDVDSYEGTAEDVLLELEHTLPYTLVAYSTYSSTVDAPRFRIVIPLASEIPAQDYEPFCKALADEFKEFKFDAHGFKPELAMYMPSASVEGVYDAFTFSKEGELLDINDFDIEKFRAIWVNGKGDGDNGKGGDVNGDGDEDLEAFLAQQPLDLTEQEIEDALAYYPAVNLERVDWLNVAIALHHQFQGNCYGMDIFIEWSSLEIDAELERYNRKRKKDRKPLATADDLKSEWRKTWHSFDKDKHNNPLTFATVIMKANELKEKEVLGYFEEIMNPAEVVDVEHADGTIETVSIGSSVVDVDSYDKLRKKLSKTSLTILPESKRQLLAQEIYESWGKEVGVSKATIKKELMPKKKETINELVASDFPEWAKDWIYIETRCKFHNIIKNYSLNREAFNQKFSGTIECKDEETSASQLMSVNYPMPTVVDGMYFPLAGEFFEYQGKAMLNTYRVSDVMSLASLENQGEGDIDADGQKVVDLFLAHVRMTFANEREQTIMLDWMSHIVQNPGERLHWALLLQGAQGTGKSYFSVVMQGILGRNVQKVKPEAILGRFSAWATGSVLNIIEEIYVSGNDKYALMNKIKDYIRNEELQIEEKGQDHRNVPNFASYLFFTNHPDALAITEDERAFCIIYGAIQSTEQLYKVLGGMEAADNYFETLFLETRRRIDAIACYLMTRQISSDFKPKSRAPLTSARTAMINYSANVEVEHMHDLIDKFNCEIINEDVIDLTYLASCIKMDFEADGIQLPPAKMTQHILLGMGFQKVPNRVKISKNEGKKEKHTVWMKNFESGDPRISAVQNFYRKCDF